MKWPLRIWQKTWLELPLHSTFSFWKRLVSNSEGLQKTYGKISIFLYILKDLVHLHHLIWVQTCLNTSASFLHQRCQQVSELWPFAQHRGESLHRSFCLCFGPTQHFMDPFNKACAGSVSWWVFSGWEGRSRAALTSRGKAPLSITRGAQLL